MTDNDGTTQDALVSEDEHPAHAEGWVARRLRELRQARGWSQADVADKIGANGFAWHQTTVAKVERGARPLRLNEAEALAHVLGVPLVRLLGPEPTKVAPTALGARNLLHTLEDLLLQERGRHTSLTREHGRAQGRVDEVKRQLDECEAKVTSLAADVEEARARFLALTTKNGEGRG